MSSEHSLWPLFCGDLSFARHWLIPQLQQVPLNRRLGHLALSLGLYDTVSSLLAQGNGGEAQTQAQLRFRLARQQGLANPYDELVPDELHSHTQEAFEQHQRSASGLPVSLNGGLGDHLEALCLLLPWAEQNGLKLKIHTVPSRAAQFKRLLEPISWLEWGGAGAPGDIPAMALRSLIYSQASPPKYKAWIPSTQTRWIKQNWLFCWRAAGAGDAFSAHCRSVPFSQVLEFYKQLKSATNQAIIDMSQWNSWEESQLQRLGIQLHDPCKGDLADLIPLIKHSDVISIDTALAHLCAAMGYRATVLLPKFPDERWVELHQPQHCYGEYLTAIQAWDFASWKITMKNLLAHCLNQAGCDSGTGSAIA